MDIYFLSKYDKKKNIYPSFPQILEFAKLAVFTQNAEIALDVCDSLNKKSVIDHIEEKLGLILEVSAQAVSSINSEAAFTVCQTLIEQYCTDKVEEESKMVE